MVTFVLRHNSVVFHSNLNFVANEEQIWRPNEYLTHIVPTVGTPKNVIMTFSTVGKSHKKLGRCGDVMRRIRTVTDTHSAAAFV